MKSKIIILLQFILYSFCFGQSFDPFIEGLMNQTNLDSLVSYVRILSGEDSVVIAGSTVLITPRGSFFENDLAADYIKSKLESYGLETYDHHFYKAGLYPVIGRNIYSIQRGKTYPDKYFFYCAHWDAITEYCADDNASGVAGVLEAARILSKYQFEYSIIYALWDYEELGTYGSWYFASRCDSNNTDIQGVLNFEMSGWDSDDDGLMDIHTKDIINSVSLANIMFIVDSLYQLPLKPIIYNPGTNASDHWSFWHFNYSAICFSEAYWGGDFNPYYHSSEDRIDKFNLAYFHNVCKLGIASLSTLATENFTSSVQEDIAALHSFYLNNYPNPFNNATIIQYAIPEACNISLDVYSSIGEKIVNLSKGYEKAGKYEIHFNASDLPSGVYFYRIQAGNFIETKKMILLR